MKQLCYLIIFVGSSVYLSAQSFLYQGSITGIKENSLYKIPLDPKIKQHMSPDLHDVRIYDSSQKEVPFILLSEPLLKAKQDFIPYEIVSQTHFKNHSEIIIKNPAKDKISNIAFNINNTDAYKYCAIEGSDDMKQWYAVSALQELSLAYNNSYTHSYQCIYFPQNNYLYFKLLADDWNTRPLKINFAGYFKNSVIAGKLNDIYLSKTIQERPEEKTTTIQLSFADTQQIDRIDFKIKNPRLFMRHARVYIIAKEKRKHKIVIHQKTLFEFDLCSDKALFFDVPHLNEKELFIEIENKDNPPLMIEEIRCSQLAAYLVCDLNAKNSYILKCGNTSLKSPEYDLGSFVTAIPQLLPEAHIEALKEIPGSKIIPSEKQTSFFETKQFLWLCLGAGAIIVLLFSLSLLKDMAKKNKE